MRLHAYIICTFGTPATTRVRMLKILHKRIQRVSEIPRRVCRLIQPIHRVIRSLLFSVLLMLVNAIVLLLSILMLFRSDVLFVRKLGQIYRRHRAFFRVPRLRLRFIFSLLFLVTHTFEIRIEVHVSFGEIRDDGKTKVHSYPLHAQRIAFGTKEKRNDNTVCPVQRRFIPHERDGSIECDFSSLFNNGREEVFTNDIRKRIKLVDDQSSKRRTSFFPISSAPFLSLSSRVAKRSNQRALASMYWQ